MSKKYMVLVGIDANQPIEVEADTPEQAAELAAEELSTNLCWQCSEKLYVSDEPRYFIVDSDDGEHYEEDSCKERIAALEREVEGLNTKISSVRSTLNHWNKFRPDLFAEPEFTDLMMVIFDEQEALAGKNQKEEFEAKNPLKEELPLPPGKTLAGGEAGNV